MAFLSPAMWGSGGSCRVHSKINPSIFLLIKIVVTMNRRKNLDFFRLLIKKEKYE